MVKITDEVIAEIRIWKDKNYLITNFDEHTYEKKIVYEHFKISFSSTLISKSMFGRVFTKFIASENHTRTHYSGLQILERPETPLTLDTTIVPPVMCKKKICVLCGSKKY